MVNEPVNPATLQRLLDRCQALAELMGRIPDLPPDTGRQIAENASLVASADSPDWAVYFARQLAGLAAGAAGHLALDVPDALDDLLGGIREDRLALRPLVGPDTPADPALQDGLRTWQRDHGVTPLTRDEPSPLR